MAFVVSPLLSGRRCCGRVARPRSVFLGARQPGYRAHIVAVTLQYRF